MQSFRYAHLPLELSTVHLALFKDVSNSAQLRARIVRASQLEGPDGDAEREAVNFAFIDARLVKLTFIHVVNPSRSQACLARSVVCCIYRQPCTRRY